MYQWEVKKKILAHLNLTNEVLDKDQSNEVEESSKRFTEAIKKFWEMEIKWKSKTEDMILNIMINRSVYLDVKFVFNYLKPKKSDFRSEEYNVENYVDHVIDQETFTKIGQTFMIQDLNNITDETKEKDTENEKEFNASQIIKVEQIYNQNEELEESVFTDNQNEVLMPQLDSFESEKDITEKLNQSDFENESEDQFESNCNSKFLTKREIFVHLCELGLSPFSHIPGKDVYTWLTLMAHLGVTCYIDKGLKAFILNATYREARHLKSNLPKRKTIKKQKDIMQCSKRCKFLQFQSPLFDLFFTRFDKFFFE